ncbi:MAG: AlpA family phage regulatory protein [Rhodospirillales bacterium]|nr:AlpA family phage regulatory protein [Rhodospirillales bacterium]
MSELRLLKAQEVAARVGLSRGHIYKLMEAGKFPKPIPISAQARRWRSDELEEWIEERTAERDPDPENE